MKLYIFSLFTRMFVALSGFLVFLITARLFGAEGRGIISYGTSLFGLLGLLFSINLGRSFLGKTSQDEQLKKNLIFSFILMNVVAALFASICGLLFWFFSEAARSIISLSELLAVSITSLVYIWMVNGNSFFAAFAKTFEQEIVILITRLIIIVFLVLLLVFEVKNMTQFLLIYSLILLFGVITEIIVLERSIGWIHERPRVAQIKIIFKEALWPYLDYIAFNAYSLLLVLIAGWYLDKASLGRVNFSFQIVNLIFLFATTANIRVSTYVSVVGFRSRTKQMKKLFVMTGLVSIIISLMIFVGLTQVHKHSYFSSFEGVASLFLIGTLSIPGFALYQFMNPVWLECGLIKKSAKLNLLNLLGCILISPIILSSFGEVGMASLFSIFNLGLLLTQGYLLKRYILN